MIITTERGEIKIENGNRILVRCIFTGFENTIKINGHCCSNGPTVEITLKDKKTMRKTSNEVFIIGRVVGFQDKRPIARFEDPNNSEITLHNINDIIDVLQV